MLRISTTAVCPKCGRENLMYVDGKFVCYECDKKYTSKDIAQTTGDLFEITTDITEQEFRAKIKQLEDLANRFSSVDVGYEPCASEMGYLSIGWQDGYPVRLNMMVQELNEILA